MVLMSWAGTRSSVTAMAVETARSCAVDVAKNRSGVVAGRVRLWGRCAELDGRVQHALHHGSTGHLKAGPDECAHAVAGEQNHRTASACLSQGSGMLHVGGGKYVGLTFGCDLIAEEA